MSDHLLGSISDSEGLLDYLVGAKPSRSSFLHKAS